MKKILLIALIFALAACGSGQGGAEPAADRPESAESLMDNSECTTPTDGRSLALFPQENNDLMINGFDLPEGSEPILRLTAVTDTPPQLIERTPTINDDGMFSETITLPETDYTRWNIHLIDGDTILCHFIIIGADGWLEMGYDGPREEDNALQQDMEQVSEQTGIPIEDLERQAANEDAITELMARISANEADTFGGLWVEWEPQYRVVLAFTENGEEIVARYLDSDNPLWDDIDIRTVTYTEDELLADQERAMQLLENAGATFDRNSAVDIQNNRVSLGVPSQKLWEEFVAQNNIDLPDTVVVEYAFEDVTFEPPTSVTPMPDVYMAQLQLPSMSFMEALLTANLIVKDGCLVAQDAESPSETTLIIWQPGFFLHNDNGTLQIVNEAGEVVAAEGELIYLGGGHGNAPQAERLVAPIPDSCATSSYWYMGEFLPEEYRPDTEE